MSAGNAAFLASHTVSGSVPSQTLDSPLLNSPRARETCLEDDLRLSLPLSEFCVFPLPDPLTLTASRTGGKGVCQPGAQA